MRLKTGIEGFDELIEGGLLKNHVYLVSGPPGSGRTTFGIQFLIQGALQNENGLYVALTDTPTNVIKNMSRFKFDLVNQVKTKKIFFMDGTQEVFGGLKAKEKYEASEIFDLAAGPSTSKDLFDKIEPIISKANIQRMVIDSTLALSLLTKSREDDQKHMAKYMSLLKQMGATTIMLAEVLNQNEVAFEHYLSNGIFFLHHFPNGPRSDRARAIQILKMRGTKHDSMLYSIEFTDKGLKCNNDQADKPLKSDDSEPEFVVEESGDD
jgi:KaiC/GvpD/RAD55 family RecA-like ATPase